MPRYKLTIEYDGAPYQGWQWQDHAPSVQGALEAAAETINGAPTVVYGAGRTDSGVHALGAVAHVDFAKDLREDKVRDAMNFHLQNAPISVLGAVLMPDEWHARFDARERRYLYRIIDRRPKLALERGRVWRLPMKLDAEAMQAAAHSLIGEHDFTTFRDTQCQAKSPVKTLDEITVLRAGAEIHVHLSARSFLHKQVRSVVGTLVDIGRGYRAVDYAQKALEARDRKACGQVAPPDGLYLVSVHYPKDADTP
jgi:tRNA pseudouridine38-40 synthase